MSWLHHSRPASESSGAADESGDNSAECADIRAQIRDSEEKKREAPVTSINPDIVSAAEGKAELRIEELRQRYDALDCPGDAAPSPGRVPPLQPAPGAINR